MLSVLSSSEHPHLAWTLNNYCSCLQEHLSKGMWIWALYWLCEIFEKSCFGFLFIWRWKLRMVGKLFVHMVPSELRMKPQGHATHLRETQVSLPALCYGKLPAQSTDVLSVSGYLVVCLIIPVQLLFWHAAMALLTDGNGTTHVPGIQTNGISWETLEVLICRAFFLLNFKGLL